jgi:hypothetical protein
MLNKISMYDPSSSHHVLNLLLLGKVIKHTVLLSHGSISFGSSAYKKLWIKYNIPVVKINAILAIVAMEYNINMANTR